MQSGGRRMKSIARAYVEAGLSVVKASKQSKIPVDSWKEFQKRRPTLVEIDNFFRQVYANTALFIICGKVSGDLEVLDFDLQGEKFEPWRELVEAKAPGLVERLLVQKTQGDGKHVAYRCPSATIPGNDHLALRLIDGKPKALIETRGEGGGILADPTLGYETLQGDFCDLPVITPKERQILWEAALSQNEFIDPKKIEGMGRRIPKGARRPGDDFNERGEVAPIIKKHGWQPVGERGPYQYWRRPGKDRGTSASLIEEKIFYNFSANAHPFDMGTAYSPFAVFAFLEHDGDYEAAAKALRKEGYGEEPEKKEKPTQAEIIIKLASHGEFFHDCHKLGFVTLPDGNIQATYPIRSTDFRLWLRRAYFQQTGKAPSAQALNDALGVIEAQALFDGPPLPVFVRVGEHGGKVYLDLGGPSWCAVEVDAQGWRVAANPPVKFVRRPGMLPLPLPHPEGTVDEMRSFLNLPAGSAGDKTWELIVSWLVVAFRPTGPYPILAIHGPQGSAKSTAARMLRSLVDPNSSPLRAEPKELRDLVISAKNGWCCAFDNLTSLPQWLSDGLCRLATGGGFATRALYTDDEEALFEAMRPVILTGINPVAASQDLIDRQVLVELQDFGTDDERQEEAIIWREFEEARPRLLGALLKGVSVALRRMETMKISRLPRMADFSKWATAAEAAWGWPDGAFLEAYAENRAGQAAASVEADLVATTLVDFMREREFWEGTPTELHETLTTLVPEEKRKLKVGKSYAWPHAPNVLTRRLRKAQVFLKHFGIRITGAHSGERTIRVDRKSQGITVHSVHAAQTQNSGGSPADDISSATVHEGPEYSGLDDTADSLDNAVGNTVHGKAPPDAGLDDVDGMDDISAIFSGEEVSL